MKTAKLEISADTIIAVSAATPAALDIEHIIKFCKQSETLKAVTANLAKSKPTLDRVFLQSMKKARLDIAEALLTNKADPHTQGNLPLFLLSQQSDSTLIKGYELLARFTPNYLGQDEAVSRRETAGQLAPQMKAKAGVYPNARFDWEEILATKAATPQEVLNKTASINEAVKGLLQDLNHNNGAQFGDYAKTPLLNSSLAAYRNLALKAFESAWKLPVTPQSTQIVESLQGLIFNHMDLENSISHEYYNSQDETDFKRMVLVMSQRPATRKPDMDQFEVQLAKYVPDRDSAPIKAQLYLSQGETSKLQEIIKAYPFATHEIPKSDADIQQLHKVFGKLDIPAIIATVPEYDRRISFYFGVKTPAPGQHLTSALKYAALGGHQTLVTELLPLIPKVEHARFADEVLPICNPAMFKTIVESTDLSQLADYNPRTIHFWEEKLKTLPPKDTPVARYLAASALQNATQQTGFITTMLKQVNDPGFITHVLNQAIKSTNQERISLVLAACPTNTSISLKPEEKHRLLYSYLEGDQKLNLTVQQLVAAKLEQPALALAGIIKVGQTLQPYKNLLYPGLHMATFRHPLDHRVPKLPEIPPASSLEEVQQLVKLPLPTPSERHPMMMGW